MTPEVKDAGNDLLVWYDRDGSVGGIVDPVERLRELSQCSPQPVDWPTEPGWWWMEIQLCIDAKFQPTLVEFETECSDVVLVRDLDDFSRKLCEYHGARFLRAHAPTFPPREDER